MDKDPLLSQMLDARTFITMETKAPPCRLSRRWQRGWELVPASPASDGGRGREKGTPPRPPGAPPPPFFWALLGGRDRVSGRNNAWRRGPWLGFSPTLFISAIKELDTVGWRSHGAWGQLGDRAGLTSRAADGCCPRLSGHRGARGIVSMQRGRHPAGKQWGMGTAHTSGSKLRGKRKGESGGKEDSCPTTSPPVDLHREHPKQVTSLATCKGQAHLRGQSPAASQHSSPCCASCTVPSLLSPTLLPSLPPPLREEQSPSCITHGSRLHSDLIPP